MRKSIDLVKGNNKYLIKENNEIQGKVKKDEAKIRNMLNKFNDNMKKIRVIYIKKLSIEK